MGGCLPGLEVTMNGGASWQTLQPSYAWRAGIQPGWPSGPHFASPLVGWIGLSPGAGPGAGGVLVTTDGGKSFRQYFAHRFTPAALDPVGDVAYAIAGPVPVGSGGNSLVRTSLKGSLQELWPPPAPSSGFASDQGPLLHGIGLPQDPSALLVSRDGGRRWSPVGNLPVRTSDGGRNWSYVP